MRQARVFIKDVFCGILTEHKYFGTYRQLAHTVKQFSSAPLLDLQRFWELVLFSWITGNSDMHCKNFSLLDIGNREYVLSPAYDLLSVALADPSDPEEMALTFETDGKKWGFTRDTFVEAMADTGLSRASADMIIRRMQSTLPEWMQILEDSFLPESLRQECILLIKRRLAVLAQ
ncbi:MAG: HipA domain-containing protein [Bacteroidales bacterium]|nr:HipA domain-containing protein [Bacteroidales bacterium]